MCSSDLGDRLALDDLARQWPTATVAPVPSRGRTPPALRVVAGPRDDWFAPDAVARLCATPWQVAAGSNRIGVRLAGPPLPRVRDDELRSEGMLPGALQVPPAGAPILLLADHPTTGGYPVLAVVLTADVPLAAQLRPGEVVRFTRSHS